MMLTNDLNFAELPVAMGGNSLRIVLLALLLLLALLVILRLRRQKRVSQHWAAPLTTQQDVLFAQNGGPIPQQKSGLFAAHQVVERPPARQRAPQEEEETAKPLAGYALNVDDEATLVNRPQLDRLLVGYLIRVTSEPRLPAKLPLYGSAPAFAAECQIAIGRHRKHNAVVISDKSVSREHAVIVRRADQLFIRDKGSTAGTLLNWQRLPTENEQPLQHNDILVFGETVYEFCIDGELIES
jgi:predicted component of type VI protein secretion system